MEKAQTKVWTPTGTRQNKFGDVLALVRLSHLIKTAQESKRSANSMNGNLRPPALVRSILDSRGARYKVIERCTLNYYF